jgi:hypothetical protein
MVSKKDIRGQVILNKIYRYMNTTHDGILNNTVVFLEPQTNSDSDTVLNIHFFLK